MTSVHILSSSLASERFRCQLVQKNLRLSLLLCQILDLFIYVQFHSASVTLSLHWRCLEERDISLTSISHCTIRDHQASSLVQNSHWFRKTKNYIKNKHLLKSPLSFSLFTESSSSLEVPKTCSPNSIAKDDNNNNRINKLGKAVTKTMDFIPGFLHFCSNSILLSITVLLYAAF